MLSPFNPVVKEKSTEPPTLLMMAALPAVLVSEKVTLPLLRPGLLAAWFWVMVHAYRELTIALMLASSQNRTAAVVIFDLWEEGSFLLLSAFGVLMFLLLMALSIVAYMVGRRFGVQEQY